MEFSPASTPSAAATAELADAALNCEPLARARLLADWVGPRRTLTASGVLRPADAMQACRHLGIELRGGRLRSALDVDELMQDWMTAVASGFLVVEGTRAWGTDPDGGESPESDPENILNAWVAATTSLLDLAEDEPCPACLIALHELHTAPGPITLEQVVNAAVATVELTGPEGLPCPNCGEIHEPGPRLGLFDLLDDDWDGEDEDVAEHVVGMIMGLLAFEAAEIAAETIRLTPLGSYLAERVFHGLVIPADADVSVVASMIGEIGPDIGRVIARPWLGARSASAAVRELLAFAEPATGRLRVSALALAGDLGIEAVDAWQEWAGKPGFGAYARLWLLDYDEPVDEDPADQAWVIADAVWSLLESLTDVVPPDVLHETVADQVGTDMAEAAKLVLGSGHPKAEMVATWLTDHQEPEPDPIVSQVKITLLGVSNPPVWRRLLVPASITLSGLHGVIQRAMGWDGGHLHVFTDRARRQYGRPDGGLEFADDSRVKLSQVVAGSRDKLRYTYDFGDDWEHEIVVEKNLAAELGQTYPSCVGGRGACPPEDCGGVWGYANLKEILADPADEEFEDRLEWMGLESGEDFKPDEFSVAEVNTRLERLRVPGQLAAAD